MDRLRGPGLLRLRAGLLRRLQEARPVRRPHRHALTRGFLGLTVACARCHDHKYDPIPTTDYYALAGVFASTDYVEVPAVPKEQVEAYDKAQAAIQAKDKEITRVPQGGSRALETEGDRQPAQAGRSAC